MENKFVFEKFDLFLESLSSDKEVSQLFEAKKEITLEEIKAIVPMILEKQKQIWEARFKEMKNIPTIAGMNSKERNEKIKASEEYKKGEYFKAWYNTYKSISKPGEMKGGRSAASLAAVYEWKNIPDAEKEVMYKKMVKTAANNNLRKISQIEDPLKKKTSPYDTPAIFVYPKEMIIEKPEPAPPVPMDFSLLNEDESKNVFKDNRWEFVDDAFIMKDPENNSRKKLEDGINQFVSDLKSGFIKTVEYINIESSASRYKNTNQAANLSWGELSYNRANTIFQLFKQAAEKYELSDEQKTFLKNSIKLDSKGQNGDGTSGPNPIAPTPFGYYDTTSKWVDGKDPRDNMVLFNLGAGGKPEGKPVNATLKVDTSKSDYDKYKYVNVSIKGTMIDGSQDIAPTVINIEKQTSLRPAYSLPYRKTWSWPSLPKLFKKRGSGPAGMGTNPFICPEF